MESILEPQDKPETEPAPKTRTPIWMIIALAALASLLAYVGISAHATRNRLGAQLRDANTKLAQIGSRATAIEDNYAELEAQSKLAFERLGLTQQELAQAKALAQQIRKEQQEKLGAISGEVEEVKGAVADHQVVLDEARSRLQKAIGDLGEQSGLIARNRQELDTLKQAGERSYFDFDIKKSKEFNRVGPVAISLRKTDTKHKKYTLALLADDMEIEKKDKTLLEPVQFYLRGSRRLREIVVYEVAKDRVAGYLSIPKQEAAEPVKEAKDKDGAATQQ